jgi:hypothetical protein
MKRDHSGQEGSKQAWRRFLEPLVGLERPVSVAKLDEALRNLTGRSGDARNEIYAYLRGTQRVGAQRAFFIGEALLTCGITWSSGPVALAVSDHLKELVALLALLSLYGDGACATIMAAVCAVLACDAPHDAELLAAQEATRKELAASNICSDELVRETWNALAKKAGAYGRLFDFPTSPWLRDAYISAGVADADSRARRVFDDLGRWATSLAREDARLAPIVTPLFERRALVDHASQLAHYDALRERFGFAAKAVSFIDVLPPTRGISAKRRTSTKGTKRT